jgi:hemolysin activation/secretion protein
MLCVFANEFISGFSVLKISPNSIRSALLGGALAFMPALVMAQAVPLPSVISPGVVDRPPPEPPRDFRPKPVEPAIEAPAAAPVPAEGREIVARLTAVTFRGVTLVDEETLQALIRPFMEKPFTDRDLAALKKAVTAEYQKRGYLLTQVVTPPQDLAGGRLLVVVAEVRLGETRVDNPGLVPQRLTDTLAAPATPGRFVDIDLLENLVLDFNDVPGVLAKLNLEPGKQPATTDVQVLLDQRPDVQRLSFDNYGSKFTGENFARLRLNKSNLLGVGDLIGVSVSHSDEDLWNAGADFRMPLYWRNLFLEADYLHSDYEIGGDLAPLGNDGGSDRLTVSVAANVVNTRRKRVALRAGVERRQHESFIGGVPESRDDLTELFAEGSAQTWLSDRWLAFGALRVVQGVDAFGASDPDDPLLSRRGADPQAFILRPTGILSWLPYPGGSLRLSVFGQWADEMLVSSDLFSLGGYGSVRGFTPSVISGERGLSGSLEFSHAFAPVGYFRFVPSVFVDAGRISREVEIPGVDVEDTLSAAGLGLEIGAKFWSRGDTRLRLDYAHPLGSYELLDASGFFYASLAQFF